MMIQILAPDPTQARLLVERFYPTARICGEPVALGPATQCDAQAFRDWLRALTRPGTLRTTVTQRG